MRNRTQIGTGVACKDLFFFFDAWLYKRLTNLAKNFAALGIGFLTMNSNPTHEVTSIPGQYLRDGWALDFTAKTLHLKTLKPAPNGNSAVLQCCGDTHAPYDSLATLCLCGGY